jgi:hypothetical protein
MGFFLPQKNLVATKHLAATVADPGWVKESGSGSGINNPDHISESLETIFRVKNT